MKASIAVLLSLFHLLAVEPAAVVLHCGVTALCVCVLTCVTPSQFLSAHSSTQSLKVDSSISSLAGQGEGKKVCLLHFNPHQHSWSSTGSFKTHSFLLSCSGVSVLSCKKRKKKKIKETRTEASSGSPLCVASSECSCWHPDCREAFMRCSFVGLRDYMSGLNVQCCDAVYRWPWWTGGRQSVRAKTQTPSSTAGRPMWTWRTWGRNLAAHSQVSIVNLRLFSFFKNSSNKR